MRKPATKVLVLTDKKAEGTFRIDYDTINAVAKDSLRMGGLDEDRGSVMFIFKEYPGNMYIKAPEDSENLSEVTEYMNAGMGTMAMIEDASFKYGRDKSLDRLTENELCHAIIDSLKCDNKTAFEISSEMREHEFHPFTHIVWTHTAKKASPFFMAFMEMRGAGITPEQYESMVENDASIMFIERCPDRKGVPAEGFTGKRVSHSTFINQEGDEHPIGR